MHKTNHKTNKLALVKKTTQKQTNTQRNPTLKLNKQIHVHFCPAFFDCCHKGTAINAFQQHVRHITERHVCLPKLVGKASFFSVDRKSL